MTHRSKRQQKKLFKKAIGEIARKVREVKLESLFVRELKCFESDKIAAPEVADEQVAAIVDAEMKMPN